MNRSSIVLSLICGVFAGSSNAVVQSFVINQGASRNCFRSSHPSTNHFSRAFSIRGGNGSALKAAAASPTPEIDDTSNSIEEYHLIWSPNFWKKLIVSFGFWAILGLVQSKYSTFVFMRYHSASCHSPMDFVLPLLSSSCCAIQLIINTISGLGCAGFNTYLGETRRGVAARGYYFCASTFSFRTCRSNTTIIPFHLSYINMEADESTTSSLDIGITHFSIPA